MVERKEGHVGMKMVYFHLFGMVAHFEGGDFVQTVGDIGEQKTQPYNEIDAIVVQYAIVPVKSYV